MAHHQPTHAKEAFSSEALDRIAATIAEVEQHTSAEIRISIIDERDNAMGGISIEALAEKEFFKLEMDKTSGRNGVLLFILYAERKFYVYGDKGIHERVDPSTWTEVAQVLKHHFSHAQFEEGLHAALRSIATHLKTALPQTSAQKDNQLTNDVSIS